MKSKLIDVLVPCLNEEENLVKLVDIVLGYTNSQYRFRVIIIDDGSSDNTYGEAQALSRLNSDIVAVRLSRNFGKEAALSAGLSISTGDAVVIIDADLQHPPTLIPEMIDKWERGYEVVSAVKAVRQPETTLKKFTAYIFNWAMGNMTGVDFEGASDFKLLDKCVVDTIKELPEKTRFFRGLVGWVGFKHTTLDFEVQGRELGDSKFTWRRLISLSVDAITSHSSKPLQITTALGVVCLIFSIGLGFQTLYGLLFGNAVSGFPTVILVVLIMSSLIMINLGIIGLYIAKIYTEVKGRPHFVIAQVSESSSQLAKKKKPSSVEEENLVY